MKHTKRAIDQYLNSLMNLLFWEHKAILLGIQNVLFHNYIKASRGLILYIELE